MDSITDKLKKLVELGFSIGKIKVYDRDGDFVDEIMISDQAKPPQPSTPITEPPRPSDDPAPE